MNRYTTVYITIAVLLLVVIGVVAINALIWLGVRTFGLMLDHPLEAFLVALFATILLFILPPGKKVGQ